MPVSVLSPRDVCVRACMILNPRGKRAERHNDPAASGPPMPGRMRIADMSAAQVKFHTTRARTHTYVHAHIEDTFGVSFAGWWVCTLCMLSGCVCVRVCAEGESTEKQSVSVAASDRRAIGQSV